MEDTKVCLTLRNKYPSRKWKIPSQKLHQSDFGVVKLTTGGWEARIKFERLMTDSEELIHWYALEYELGKFKQLKQAKAAVEKRAQELADSDDKYTKINYPRSKKAITIDVQALLDRKTIIPPEMDICGTVVYMQFDNNSLTGVEIPTFPLYRVKDEDVFEYALFKTNSGGFILSYREYTLHLNGKQTPGKDAWIIPVDSRREMQVLLTHLNNENARFGEVLKKCTDHGWSVKREPYLLALANSK